MIQEFKDPDLHDATIKSLSIDDANALEIRCQLDGEAVTMVVQNVIDLRADDFLRQNVIASVELYTGVDCPLPLLEYLSLGSPARVSALRAALEQGVGTVLRVESVIGCRVVAYFTGDFRVKVDA